MSRRTQSLTVIMLLTAATILLGGILYVLASLIPWHPVSVEEVRTQPDVVCPLDAVFLKVSRTVDEPTLPPSVRDLRVIARAQWHKEGSDEVTAIQETVLVEELGELDPLGKTVLRTRPSTLQAPPITGEWRLVTTYDVIGTPFLAERSYTINVPASNTLHVYERCWAKGGT